MTASPLAQKAADAFNAPICETDPEIAELLTPNWAASAMALR